MESLIKHVMIHVHGVFASTVPLQPNMTGHSRAHMYDGRRMSPSHITNSHHRSYLAAYTANIRTKLRVSRVWGSSTACPLG